MSRFKIFAILVCTAVNLAYCQDTVESLEYLIKTGVAEALKYETPTDASKYRPKDNLIKEYDKSFDFIIIGGGISGSVLASRLSEEKKFSVLVIEAGKFADNGILKIPKYSYIGWLSDYNWGFKSIPQTTACLGTINNQCMYPRGKGVGGTSLINGLLYDRTSPENYNIIAALVNDSSWSYINVLKYFKKSERFHWIYRHAPVDPEFHGTHGLLDVQHQVPDIRLNDLWLKANEEMGIPVRDYNGARHSGGSIYQSYVRNGKRLDMGTAFLIPFLQRENLKVLTESYVTKIIINKNTKTAEEVLFTKNGTMYSVKCNKEIILSAGTVSSPQILMLSGIGPKDHLKEHGIDVLEDLQVGTKFLDQPGTKNFMFATNYTSVNQTLKEQIEDFLNGKGKLTSPTTAQGIGFYRVSSRNFGIPDLEILYDLSTPSDSDKKINGWDSETYQTLWTNSNVSVSFAIRMVQPKSVGTIRLNSSDPFVYPLIDTNYLSDRYNEDIEVMYKGVNMVFNLIKTPAFRSINLTYVTPPLPACNKYEYMSKDYWYCFIRQVSLTCAHPVGTCAMGSDKSNGVVDSELKVFGVNRLRVVDASIIPRILDGHISIPCVMIAEKIADVIKKQYIKQKRCQLG